MNTIELIERFAEVKRRQAPLLAYMRKINHPMYRKLRECGTYLELRQWLEHDDETTLLSANFCKKPTLCNQCAIRRAAKMTKAYELKINHLLEQESNRSLIPAMLTFTVKNGPDFLERFNHLRHKFESLRKISDNYKMRGGLYSELEKIKGAVGAFEFKLGKNSKQWHPHFHVFVLLESYINANALRLEWNRVTGDSKSVDIRRCQGGILAGLIEVLKYSTKFSDLSPPQTIEVYEKTKRMRLIRPYGILRGVEIPPIDQDDPLDGDYIDYCAYYLHSKGRYNLKPIAQDIHPDIQKISEERIAEEKAIRRKELLTL